MNGLATSLPGCSENLATTTYPCTGLRLYAQPLVLIHGWGMDSQIWAELPRQLSQFADVITLDLPGFAQSPVLESYSETDLHQWMAQLLPECCYLIGLSLGGMLSCGFAARYPQRVAGLICLSSNSRFVVSDTHSAALDNQQYLGFLKAYGDDRDNCLKRFSGLQAQGDIQQRQLIRQLRGMQVVLNTDSGSQLLVLLGEIDNHEALTQLSCPTLTILGQGDVLVPVASADQIAGSNTQIDIAVIKGAGHLPHLTQRDIIVEKIKHFLDLQLYALDKAKVADSFGRAAHKYDRAAVLQHQVGEQLIAGLAPNPELAKLIDLGCGTGYHWAQLQAAFPNARVTGVDLSPAMLAYAASRHPAGHWLCGDAEDLPLEDQSQDLILSNFALQWCSDLPRLCGELFRVLKPGGQLCFAVPGPQTLSELRSAWQQVDAEVHVNRFYALGDWQVALEQAGFSQVELQNDNQVQQHSSVRELLMELKNVGAHNNNAGKQNTLTGKQHLQALYGAYENYRQADGTIPATWEIIRARATA
jgi:malonyl-CoA O-methyltransferase